MSANGFDEPGDDMTNRRAVALVCLTQAIDILTAVVALDTSPADEAGQKAIAKVKHLISDAEDLLGIRKLDHGDD